MPRKHVFLLHANYWMHTNKRIAWQLQSDLKTNVSSELIPFNELLKKVHKLSLWIIHSKESFTELNAVAEQQAFTVSYVSLKIKQELFCF